MWRSGPRRLSRSTPSWSPPRACGTTLKDYGFMLRHDPDCGARGRPRLGAGPWTSANICRGPASFRPTATNGRVGRLSRRLLAPAWPAKSRVSRRELLARTGYAVKDVPEGHLCCGSAGTYNILQPDIAKRLRTRKSREYREASARCDRTPAMVGCIRQIAAGTAIPGGPSGRADRLGNGGQKCRRHCRGG